MSLMFDKKQSSLRLKSEFNDLKRTADSVAKELNYNISEINNFLSGKYDLKYYLDFLIKFCDFYPVNMSNLIIYKKDTKNGILFFNVKDSIKSTRIFKSKNKEGKLTSYYEYRDTAKSNLSNFYPEWIAQTRYVKDSDPYNPDVIYNRGHLLHQLNLFVGPVNFYYEINGKKICKEMNTGDTSYISPYVKHSFTTRDKSKLAYIVAVTAGTSLKRNQNELRMFGKHTFNKLLDNKKEEFYLFKKIINRALNNEVMNLRNFEKTIGTKLYKKVNNKEKFRDLKMSEILKISESLKISSSEIFYSIKNEKEVINKFFDPKDFHYFPSENKKFYKIYKSARSENFPNLKGFIIEVSSKKIKDLDFKFTLNIYLINYGIKNLKINWEYNSKSYTKLIKPGDSIYIEPFLNFNLTPESDTGLIFIVTSESGIDLNTQKEITSIRKADRLIIDDEQWFEGK